MSDIAEIIAILNEVRILINSEYTDLTWSRYETLEDVLNEIDLHISRLKENNILYLSELTIIFAPTGSFQEVSISNGWGNEYIQLASRFDAAIEKR